MNKQRAKQMARSGITARQICDMLTRAFESGAVDNSPSVVNKQFTKAQVYQMYLSFREDGDKKISSIADILGATNALRDFGEYWREDGLQTTRQHTY